MINNKSNNNNRSIDKFSESSFTHTKNSYSTSSIDLNRFKILNLETKKFGNYKYLDNNNYNKINHNKSYNNIKLLKGAFSDFKPKYMLFNQSYSTYRNNNSDNNINNNNEIINNYVVSKSKKNFYNKNNSNSKKLDVDLINISSKDDENYNIKNKFINSNNKIKDNKINNNNNIEDISSLIQTRNISQSSISIDLNKFKINSYNDINSQNFNEFENSNYSQNKNSLNKKNKNNINNNINLKKLLSNFKPYDIKYFFNNKNNNNKNILNNTKVNNISPIFSNYQMILNNKKKKDELIRKDSLNPSKIFQNKYQQESRRLMIELIKIDILKNNDTCNNLLVKNNYSSLILNKPQKKLEDNNKYETSKNIDLNNENFSPIKNNDTILEKSILSLNSFKNDKNNITNFLNNMDDDSSEKISYLTFLTIPRLMKMIITNENKPLYLFYTMPTSISFNYGMESYIFKWMDCKYYNQIGFFDLINIENVRINNNDKKIIEINIFSNSNEGELNYLIETDNEDIALKYEKSLRYISQLIKCRVFYKKNNK